MTPDRSPLDVEALAARIGPDWRLECVAQTGSTNADLVLRAGQGEPSGLVRVAERQTAGRGRLDRQWESPAGAGLTFSLLVRPEVDPGRWGWLPLLAGVALAEAVGSPAALKWPNDLLLGPSGRKAAGILVQSAGLGSVTPAAVIGIGLNISTTAEELPVPTATSLAIEHVERSRAEVLSAFLAAFRAEWRRWEDAGGDARASGLFDRYTERCATLGSRVRADLPAGPVLGVATAVDEDGRLLLRPDRSEEPGSPVPSGPPGQLLAIGAGDITHLRPASG